MIRLALRLAWDVYVLGVVFWLGAAWGEGRRLRGRDWLALWVWPVGTVYGLVWGRPRARRWFCALVGFLRHGDPYRGHRWRPTVRGFQRVSPAPGVSHTVTLRGRQCARCWLSEGR